MVKGEQLCSQRMIGLPFTFYLRLRAKSYASIEAPAGPAGLCCESPAPTADSPVFLPQASVLTARSFTLTKKIHLPKFKLSLMISDSTLHSPYKEVGFAG